jgi:hypothetical protein
MFNLYWYLPTTLITVGAFLFYQWYRDHLRDKHGVKGLHPLRQDHLNYRSRLFWVCLGFCLIPLTNIVLLVMYLFDLWHVAVYHGKLWTKVKHFAERLEKKVHMDLYHSDQCCPRCKTWQSNCGGWAKVEMDQPEPHHDILTCGKCGERSVFLDFGMGFKYIGPAG